MRGLRRGLFWVAVAALVGVGVGVAARLWAISPVKVTSESMAPALVRGDWLVTSELDPRDHGASSRGEIVLFRYPLGTTGRAVKRVIAVGGDTVAYTNRYVSVNGTTTPIAGSPADLGPDGEPTGQRQPRRVVRVPAGYVFLLGDNSAVSIDSRSFGPVPEPELVGRVRFVIPRPSWWSVAAVAAGALALGGLLLAAWRRRRPDTA